MNLSKEEKSIIDSILFIKDKLSAYSNFPVVLIYHLPGKNDFTSKTISEMSKDSGAWMSQNWTHPLFSDILNVINKLEDKGYIYIDKPKGTTVEEYIKDTPTINKEIPKLFLRDKMSNSQLLRHKYANIHVYPSLADFKLNDYKTTEEKQLEEAKKQTTAANRQTTIVIITLIINLLTPVTKKLIDIFTKEKEQKVKVEIENFQDIPQNTIIFERKIDSVLKNTGDYK